MKIHFYLITILLMIQQSVRNMLILKHTRFMMYQSLGHTNVSNTTITSIIYLLQTAGASLLEIQVSTSMQTWYVQ